MSEPESAQVKKISVKKETHVKIGIVLVCIIIGYIISLFTPILTLGVILMVLGGLGYGAFKIWKDLNDQVNKIGQQTDDE